LSFAVISNVAAVPAESATKTNNNNSNNMGTLAGTNSTMMDGGKPVSGAAGHHLTPGDNIMG